MSLAYTFRAHVEWNKSIYTTSKGDLVVIGILYCSVLFTPNIAFCISTICYDFHNRLWTDEDVWMISVETPMVFAKACEMFMKKLTMRGWANVEIHKGNMILSLGM
ncbi:Nuclear transcription factor Y subunit C-6 [Glycine max]|nr:Nuclear transcription factor Y subunit C-6 [Glycine max]